MSIENKKETRVIFTVKHVDPSITDFYINFTTEKQFKRIKADYRKHYDSDKKLNKQYLTNLVNFMKNNGGFDKFNFEKLEIIEYKSFSETQDYVNKLIAELGATINNTKVETREKLNNEGSSNYHAGIETENEEPAYIKLMKTKPAVVSTPIYHDFDKSSKNKYNRGFIYRMYHKDPSIKDCYIGSTINLKGRVDKHRDFYKNEHVPQYNYLIYRKMRELGGWDNFDFEIYEYWPCNNDHELELREDYWIRLLEPSMNVNNAVRKKEDDYCHHNAIARRCVKCREEGMEITGLCHHNNRVGECPKCRDEGIEQSAFCIHKQRNNRCAICHSNPSGKCMDHNSGKTRKENCVSCAKMGRTTATNICGHFTQKQNCITCKREGKTWATNICEHYNRKDRCVSCGTNKTKCEHNCYAYTCKECWEAGKEVKGRCNHGFIKARCKICKEINQ